MSSQSGLFVFLFLLNCVVMIIFYLVLRSRFSARKILSELRSEVDKLVTDLGREADRDVALLESRIKNLRSLIDEADRRIMVANRETVKKQNEKEIIAETKIRRDVKAAYAAPSEGELSGTEMEPVPGPEAALIQQKAVPRKPVVVYARPVINRSETPIEPIVPLKERVIEMAQKGISAPMIANTLSVSLGEVELILDMNNSSL